MSYIEPHTIERTNDCFHICFGTGQCFSNKQWSDYLKRQRASVGTWLSEVRNGKYGCQTAYNVGKFDYNINDVCQNPNTIIFEDDDDFVKIFTSEWCDSSWCSGYMYNIGTSGGGHGSIVYQRQDSERDAIVYTINKLLKDNTINRNKTIIKQLQEYLFTLKCVQLTLF